MDAKECQMVGALLFAAIKNAKTPQEVEFIVGVVRDVQDVPQKKEGEKLGFKSRNEQDYQI